MSREFVKFKEPKQSTTLHMMHPLLVMIMFDMASWSHERKIDFVVTDTISTVKKDSKLGRIHAGHRERRAFDLRSRTFSEKEQQLFIEHFNEKYKSIAQVSESDLESRLVVLHGEGDNEHFHIGLHSRFKVSY